ncbi:caspase domain-containing protein [Mycena capillaripes]|nr:caspase domain-containing protein [Mycena capillaripes]
MKIGRYTGLRSLRRTSVPAVPPKPSTQDDKLEDAKDANTKDDTKEEDSEPYTPKRRALLIGISYSGADPRMKEDGYGELRGSHADVAAMRRLLVGRYGYREGDVVVLFDGEEGTIQPTRVNILRAIDDLVRGARKGDRFFFHYCGHTTQIENHSNSEENGMDECLVPIDGEPQKIMDNELRLHLVSALPVGSSLVAVFDSCHSASLLDLAHFRCNRVYVPWLSKGRRRSDERWNAVGEFFFLFLAPVFLFYSLRSSFPSLPFFSCLFRVFLSDTRNWLYREVWREWSGENGDGDGEGSARRARLVSGGWSACGVAVWRRGVCMRVFVCVVRPLLPREARSGGRSEDRHG